MANTTRDPALLLGDVNAEADELLPTAFYESPDYKTILGFPRGRIVVGRRGTGKSALAWKLRQAWGADSKTVVFAITPSEDSMIGLRSLCESLVSYAQLRAFFRIAWKVAMGREALSHFINHYKFKSDPAHPGAVDIARSWINSGSNIVERLAEMAREQLRSESSPEAIIGGLQKALEWTSLDATLTKALGVSKMQVALVIDRVDEGYLPDDRGLAIVAGLVTAAIEVSNEIEDAVPVVFLRDNIARAIAAKDEDYARAIESRTIRLHWGDRELFEMTAARLRPALGLDVQSSKAIWNRFVTDSLRDITGFRKCLRHTLYRPRDVLVLLNKAYYECHKLGGSRLSDADVAATAKTISSNRLSDLLREYEAVEPGLEQLVRGLGNQSAHYARDDLLAHLQAVMEADQFDARAQQGLQLIESPASAIRLLYEFGVVGAQDPTSGSYAFCHDGHELVHDLTKAASFLVHPCYWMALDISGTDPVAFPDEIHDDYGITATARTPQERIKNINRLVSKLPQIERGTEGAGEFEDWCHMALCTLFAGRVRNLQLKANSAAPNRRDIVGRNVGDQGIWQHLAADYKVRQIVFEVKNYDALGPDEFRQVLDYLHDQYGTCGFIICRSDSTDVRTGPVLDRIRDIWANHKKLIVILTGKFLARLLGKIRSPIKFDAASQDLERLVDDYERLYIHGQQVQGRRRKSRRRK